MGWLLPGSDVRSAAVYHPMEYPRAAFAQFLPGFPFPPQQCLGGYGTRQNSFSPWCWTISLYFFFNSFAGSYVVPWLLYMGKKTLCSSKAFTTCEHLQLWARRPTAAGSQERAAWLLPPARCSCIDTQHLVHAPMGALATKRTFPCNSSRAWKGYDAANKPFSISCFLGGFVAWCCLPRLFSIKCH